MDKDSISGSSGEDNDNYYTEIVQPKSNKGFVLVVSAYGTKKFKQQIIDALQTFDFDDESANTIDVSDIHGQNIFKPDYEPDLRS